MLEIIRTVLFHAVLCCGVVYNDTCARKHACMYTHTCVSASYS